MLQRSYGRPTAARNPTGYRPSAHRPRQIPRSGAFSRRPLSLDRLASGMSKAQATVNPSSCGDGGGKFYLFLFIHCGNAFHEDLDDPLFQVKVGQILEDAATDGVDLVSRQMPQFLQEMLPLGPQSLDPPFSGENRPLSRAFAMS